MLCLFVKELTNKLVKVSTKEKYMFECISYKKNDFRSVIIYLKNCTGVTESQIVRMCKSYLTFSRDRNTAPVYDEPTGHVIGLYNVSYSRTGWQLGTHWTRILDDNEIVLRKDFQFLTFQD